MSYNLRTMLWPLIDICNFGLYYMTFYFFFYKASDLMANKKRVLKILRRLCYVIILLMVFMAPAVYYIYNDKIYRNIPINKTKTALIMIIYRVPQVLIFGNYILLWMVSKSVKQNLASGQTSRAVA